MLYESNDSDSSNDESSDQDIPENSENNGEDVENELPKKFDLSKINQRMEEGPPSSSDEDDSDDEQDEYQESKSSAEEQWVFIVTLTCVVLGSFVTAQVTYSYFYKVHFAFLKKRRKSKVLLFMTLAKVLINMILRIYAFLSACQS